MKISRMPETWSRPTLLICGFGGFPGFSDNPASRVVERMQAADWALPGVIVTYQVIPTTWAGGHARAHAAAAGADAVLVLGVAGGADQFRVEAQACNRAGSGRADAEGAMHPGDVIAQSGPAVAAATAPIDAMLVAIRDEGLPAEMSSDAGDYLCNYVFYRLLTETAAPCTAFLHLPPGLSLDDLERGARAAASAMAPGLSALRPEERSTNP